MERRPNRHLPRPAIGWPLLPVPDAAGGLDWPDLETSVRQTIRVILLTRRRELLLSPGFGVGLADFLHQPNTLITRRRIRDAIVQGLANWEPRIAVDRVEVEPDPERPERLRIGIGYRIKRSGAPGAVRLSLLLEG